MGATVDTFHNLYSYHDPSPLHLITLEVRCDTRHTYGAHMHAWSELGKKLGDTEVVPYLTLEKHKMVVPKYKDRRAESACPWDTYSIFCKLHEKEVKGSCTVACTSLATAAVSPSTGRANVSNSMAVCHSECGREPGTCKVPGVLCW